MDRDDVREKWSPVRGEIRESWRDFTDEDLTLAARRRDVLFRAIRERAGAAMEREEPGHTSSGATRKA